MCFPLKDLLRVKDLTLCNSVTVIFSDGNHVINNDDALIRMVVSLLFFPPGTVAKGDTPDKMGR